MESPANAAAPDAWSTSTSLVKVSTHFGDVVLRTGGSRLNPSMVFWPGLLFDASMWSYQFEHFASNYHVILIDPPGIGRSAPLRRPISIDDSALCLRQILDALNIERCIAVGNSWGSLTVAVFAASCPARLRAAILTNGTAAAPAPQFAAQMAELVSKLEQCSTTPEWLLAATQHAYSSDTAQLHRPEFLDYMRRVLQEDPISISFAIRGVILGRTDLHPIIRQIRDVPVLVIAGAEDRLFDVAESRSFASSIANTEFVLLPHAGHLSPRERPLAVNASIDAFLATHLKLPTRQTSRE